MKTIYHRNSGNTSRYKKLVFLLVLNIIVLGGIIHANNLTLGSTITIVDANKISFTIKWDNSWYASTVPNNWDAVWVFIKYKDCTTTNWLHAPLSTTGTDHTVTGGVLQVDAVTDGMGVFVRRTATGSGNIASSTVTLKLNGIATGTYNFKVFGIEMVKVLNENFQLGDGSSTNRFNSVSITSEAAITEATLGGTGTVDLPAAYPKGWNAFYCMKHEITQEQVVDFLNCLTYNQQAANTWTSPTSVACNYAFTSSARGVIKIQTQGVSTTTPAVYACDLTNNCIYNESCDGQNMACGTLLPNTILAYLDWAALRPMTELEFEKVCRGAIPRISGEYAWGNAMAMEIYQWNNNTGCANETIGSTNGSGGRCVGRIVWNANGPLRVGIAATAGSTRVDAGASYYGALEMSGNVWEIVVSTTAGSAFTGTLGDGDISATGTQNQTGWNAANVGYRGGAYFHNFTDGFFRTSDRQYATSTSLPSVNTHYGGRGVR